jgi:hypothetical protein
LVTLAPASFRRRQCALAASIGVRRIERSGEATAVNERQRDLFLYPWSRRRAPGRGRILLRGAVVGALGGIAFAMIMAAGGAHTPGVFAYDTRAGTSRCSPPMLACRIRSPC